jgi:pullulanase/glycogen debranching enzyme
MKRIVIFIIAAVIAGGVYFVMSKSATVPSSHVQPKQAAVESTASDSAPDTAQGPLGTVDFDMMPKDVVLAPGEYTMPGEQQTWGLRYRNPAAKHVFVSGAWDGWEKSFAMTEHAGVWMIDLRPLKLVFGRNDFKFISDGKWEQGKNRSLYINEDGLVERPEDLIFAANLVNLRRIEVAFKRDVKKKQSGCRARVRAQDGSFVPVRRLQWQCGHDESVLTGFSVAGSSVFFRLDPGRYQLGPDEVQRVAVAGTFNGWNPGAGGWQLHRADNSRIWELTVAGSAFGDGLAEGTHRFKFVVNGSNWLEPSIAARNAVADGKGHINLQLDPKLSSSTTLAVELQDDLKWSEDYMLILDMPGMRIAYRAVFPLPALDALYSDKPLGAMLDKAAGQTTFRIFAPRATKVALCIYDGPYLRNYESGELVKPVAEHEMRRDADGVWEVTVPGVGAGTYYAFRVAGPTGPGEGFNAQEPVADPYARAVAHAGNAAIVIDPEVRLPSEGTPAVYTPPKWADVLIYETHVRDLTILPSSGVDEKLRGRYAGVVASEGTATGLDHLKKLGVNMIEFMPVSEFENGVFGHSWGYGPAFYFAPEASYGSDPLHGSQYYEFRDMVNELHRRGFGVILDVVFNHVGSPNAFYAIDRKYYFRQNNDLVMNNFSGCGNDLRTEAPMMRRFIVENILYWMREHKVDGFRFDLAELIDMDTLREIERVARKENPNVILISEPWSFRGDHKRRLKGTGWAAWNNEYRDPVKYFIAGHGDRQQVMKAVVGSEELWTANPLQSVNYLESHDDMCLTDELARDPKKNGNNLTDDLGARSRLGATLLFTSLGVPMLAEGQEFLRSKFGLHNTFDRGDAANALRWDDRERPIAKLTQNYYAAMARLRLSPAGKPLRARRNSPGYYRWILPSEKQALGYIINASAAPKGRGKSFAVLINASEQAVVFEGALPVGCWLMIGDGKRIDMQGVDGRLVAAGAASHSQKIRVPRLSSYIFMRR